MIFEEIVHLQVSKFLIVIDYNVDLFDEKNLVSSKIVRLHKFWKIKINTCAMVEWLWSKIEEISTGLWRISLEIMHRHAPQWIARNRSINDGSKVNGVARNIQSFDVTSKIDL